MKSIVKGNDFTMRIPVVKMVEGEKVAFPLPACTDVEVRLTGAYKRIALDYEVDVEEDNVLLAHVTATQLSLGTFALEVKGKLFGAAWRSNEYEQIRIVDNNAKGDTVFTPDEGEDSVEMDTAVVVLPPDKVVSQLVEDVTAAVHLAQQAKADTEATDSTVQANEEVRKANETARQTAEDARQQAETARQTAETARQEQETAREQAETTRQEQEAKRESDTAAAIAAAHVSVAYDPDKASIVITTGEE